MTQMGEEYQTIVTGIDRKALGSVRIAIVASDRYLDHLKRQPAVEWLGNAEFVPLPANQPIEPEMLASCDIAIVEIDPAGTASLARINNVKQFDPDLPLIVALASGEIALVRTLVKAGVSDVVALPLDAEEILQTVLALMEVRAAQASSNTRLAPVIAVARSTAGCGSTTVATHLAAALADCEAEKSNVCLIDLDLQYGRVAEAVGLKPRRSIDDLLQAGGRLDAAYLRSVVTPHSAGFAIVAAPPDISPIEAIEVDRLSAIIRTARREFDYVIVDMPANLTNWGLSFLSSADQVLMVIEPSVTSIKQAKRRIDLFRNLGLDLRLVSIVLNKAGSRVFSRISSGDIEQALHRPVDARLRDDAKSVPIAQEQGLLAQEWRAKSVFWSDIRDLTDFLLANRLAGFSK